MAYISYEQAEALGAYTTRKGCFIYYREHASGQYFFVYEAVEGVVYLPYDDGMQSFGGRRVHEFVSPERFPTHTEAIAAGYAYAAQYETQEGEARNG